MKNTTQTKIGLVQINNSFFKQNYIPYSVGIIQAYSQKYAKNIDDLEFLLPIYKRISINDALEKLAPADIVLFSAYVWNFNLSREIARRLKEKYKDKLIIFGGCHIPKKRIDEFMLENPYIDIVCLGEGEFVVKEILDNYNTRSWDKVPSIVYRNENDDIIKNQQCERINNLDDIPSPYLEGTFKPLIASVSDESWIALWETNRGCPFGCSYCEWGDNYQKKFYSFSMDRLKKEIDWMSDNKIEFIFCCDSNFGILDRDIDIAMKVAENKRQFNYPQALSVQNTKNSTDRTFEIMKLLSDSKLSKGVNLAFQSMNSDTLKSIGRQNISNESFSILQKKFNEYGIETFSDIILGLPEETYDSYTKGIDMIIKSGQHNRIQFNNLSLLPNSEMGEKEYQNNYGIKFVKSRIINIHGSLVDNEEIEEMQDLVIETKKMPREEWIKARTFSYMISFLHFDKLLQIPFVILNGIYGIGYKELTEAFINCDHAKYPIIAKIVDFFERKSRDIQDGREEFCESKEWLNIWWPADELNIIKLFTSGEDLKFYNESGSLIKEYLENKSINSDPLLIEETIGLNKELIKLPFQNKNKVLELNYNLWELYKSILSGKDIKLNKGKKKYKIDKTKETWNSWEEWCQKVVWYGNKKGAYIYNVIPI